MTAVTAVIVILAIWFATGILGFGLSFAYFQREYPRLAREDRDVDTIRCAVMAIFGPVSLVATLVCFGWRHGLMWPWNPSPEYNEHDLWRPRR